MNIITSPKIIKSFFLNVKIIAKFVTVIVYVINAFQHILLIEQLEIVLKESQDVLIMIRILLYLWLIIIMGILIQGAPIVIILIIIFALTCKKRHVLKSLILI